MSAIEIPFLLLLLLQTVKEEQAVASESISDRVLTIAVINVSGLARVVASSNRFKNPTT